MIMIGVNCQNCGAVVHDSIEQNVCSICGINHSAEILDQVTMHHQAKMRLVNRNTDPVSAVIILAEASITTASLYKD